MTGRTTLASLRQRFPQYSDVDDARFADAVYDRFYSDMPREEYNRRLQFEKPQDTRPRMPDFDTPDQESEIKREITRRRLQGESDATAFVGSSGDAANRGGLYAPIVNPAGFFGGGIPEALNLSDEAAGLSARARNFYDRITGNNRARLDPEQVSNAERDRLNQRREDRPVAQGAREILSVLPLAATAPATTTLRGGMAVGMAEGAGFGAAQGFGSGDGINDRVNRAAQGATVGAAVGAAVPVGIEAGGRVLAGAGASILAPLGRFLQRRHGGGDIDNAAPSERAAFREVMTALEADGYSREEAASRLRQFATGGANEDVAYQLFPDASNFLRLVRGSGSTRGPGQQTLIQTIDANRRNQASRLADDFGRLLDPNTNFNQELDRVVQTRAQNAAPLYRHAFFEDPRSGRSRTFNDAVAETAESENAFVERMAREAEGLRRAPQGGVSLSEFARSMGGISDARGDLRAIGGTNFGGNLIRNNGRSIDEIGEAAQEAGYFFERPSVREILEALDEETRGRPLYSQSDVNDQASREGVESARRWFDENGVNIHSSPDRLRSEIRSQFRPDQGESATLDDVIQAATAATLQDGEVGLRVIQRTPELNSVLSRADAAGAMQNARRLSGTRGGRFTVDRPGPVAVIDLHHLRLGVGDRIERATGNERAYLMQLRNDLDAAMPAEYATARNSYAQDSRYADAMQLGRAAIRRGDTEDAVSRLEALTPDLRQFARIGAVRELRETIGRRGDRTNAARSIVDNPVARARLRALFDSDTEFDQFVQAVDQSDTLARVDGFVDPRVGTSMRHADANEGAMRDLADGAVSIGVAGASGNPGVMLPQAMRAIANTILRRRSARSQQDVNRAIADLATARPDNPQMQRVFDQEVRRSLGDDDYQLMLITYRSMFPGAPIAGASTPQIIRETQQTRQ